MLHAHGLTARRAGVDDLGVSPALHYSGALGGSGQATGRLALRVQRHDEGPGASRALVVDCRIAGVLDCGGVDLRPGDQGEYPAGGNDQCQQTDEKYSMSQLELQNIRVGRGYYGLSLSTGGV